MRSSGSVVLVMPGREQDARRVIEVWSDVAPELDATIWSGQGPVQGKDAVAAVVWNHPHGCLTCLPRLRGIVSYGAGVDRLLMDPLLPHGVAIGRTVDTHLQQDLAQYVALALLAWRRGWRWLLEAQREQRWAPRGYRRSGTVALLGLGVLGRAVAERLTQTGLGPVIGWSRRRHEIAGVESLTGLEGLLEAVGRADEVVCCLPLTRATTGILNRRLFAAMRPGTYLINAGRGEHLVEEDLVEALDAGRLGGACLDVFRREPLPTNHPFWSDARITVTPHIASLTDPGSVASQLAESVRRIAAGQPAVYPVDPDRGY